MKRYELRFPWDLDWNLLRTYMVLVEQQGVTKAANFLGLTQPTISSALKRLEQTVGKKLVERSAGGFAVTAAGKVLYAECSSMFGTVSQIPGLLTPTTNTIGGHISIAMTSHVICPHFDEVLQEFGAVHQDVTFSLTVMESDEVVERIRENRVTLGLCLMNAPEPKLKVDNIYKQQFGLYCGPNHEFFGREDIDFTELRGQPSVAFQTEVESGPLAGVRRMREEVALDPKIRAVTANLPELRRMIVVGIGVGAMPVHVARRDVEAGLLWPLPVPQDLPTIDMFSVRNPARSLTQGETVFLEMLDALLINTDIEERTYR